MAGLLAILTGIALTVWRDLRSLQSLSGNNLLLFVLLVMYQQPESIAFFVMIFGILLIGPLSSDPLAKVPPERVELWPIDLRSRIILRIASLVLTPLIWIAVPFLFRATSVSFALLLLTFALAAQIIAAAGRLHLAGCLRVPGLHIRLGGLIQNNIRQMLSVLDVYGAAMLSLGGSLYRAFGHNPDADAFMMLALLVVLALSTYAQCLFGLDLPWGMLRYHIMPLRGFEILFAKDVVFLAFAFLLVLFLAPLPGLAAALVALAVGHYVSVRHPLAQQRWHFTAGMVFPGALVQVMPMFAIGIATARSSSWYLLLAIAGYLFSLWFYGREWDRSV